MKLPWNLNEILHAIKFLSLLDKVKQCLNVSCKIGKYYKIGFVFGLKKKYTHVQTSGVQCVDVNNIFSQLFGRVYFIGNTHLTIAKTFFTIVYWLWKIHDQ